MQDTHATYVGKRESGVSLIGALPWGSHFCQFYQSREDLLEILVPYLRAGLQNNELCLWVVNGPQDVEEAGQALQKAVPRFEEYAQRGQVEILSRDQWRSCDGQLIPAVVSRLDQAVFGGFDGLRLACDALVEEAHAPGVRDTVDALCRYNVIAAFAYPRDEFDAVGLMAVVKNHRFALVKNAGRWEVIESSEAQSVNEALRRSEEKLHSVFANMSEGFAYHRIVLDARGTPCDYVFLEVNESFERLTGLKGEDLIGRRATQVLPGIERDPADWIGTYGRVALSGKPVQFENYSQGLRKWYSVSAFSPHKGFFAVTFSDITERKATEQALREANERLQNQAEELQTQAEELHAQAEELHAQAEELQASNEELRQQELTLRESEERFRATYEHAAIGIELLSLDGRLLRGNGTLCRILGYSQQELRRHRFSDITHPEDLPREMLLLDDLLAGRSPSYTIEKRYLHKNGRSVWVRVTSSLARVAAPYRISIIEDITERKQTEEALRESEERYRRFFDEDLTGDFLAWPDGTVIECNPAFAEIYGCANVVAAAQSDLARFNPEDWARLMARLKVEGKVLGHQCVHRRPDGTDIHVVANVVGRFDEAGELREVKGYLFDDTERKRAEEALREGEERYRRFFDEDLTGDFLARPDGTIIACNPAFAEIYGYADLATAVQGNLSRFNPEDWADLMARLRVEGKVQGYQCVHRRPDGTIIQVVANVVGRLDETGELREVKGYLFDDTERKHAEAQLLKLNRTLQALSNSSQVLMHATEEAAYLQDVCKIVVEDCGHALTWIGYAEADEAKSIRPVAYAGFEAGYLEALHVTWADTERGRGPTGTAIRTGRPYLCRNMLTDPDFAPWRQQAIQQGYASSIGLPLLSEGQAFGAITIYSREPDAFSEDEVDLLMELASDLAYGITSLRLRAAHARAEESLRESEQRLRWALQGARGGVWDWDLRTGEAWWSPEMQDLWGTGPGATMRLDNSLTVIHEDDRERVRREVEEAIAQRKEYQCEFRIRHATRGERWIASHGQLVGEAGGSPARLVGISLDITARRQAERERELAVQFLGQINTSAGLPDLIKAATNFFREQSGCEAVGVRLKDGDDFPYYETRGFPAAFVLAENSLCCRDANGRLERDAVGNPVVACMCGNVICGRFDPSKPFFSPAGSFWTNCTTQLLASTTEADRQARTRNCCNGEGYESVALLPLRVGEERLGLLQLNDKRPGRFTPELIASWERLSAYLAVAIAKARVEESLRRSEQRLRLALEGGGMGRWEWDVQRDSAFWDERVYELLGVDPEVPAASSLFFKVIDRRDRDTVRQLVEKALAGGEDFHAEYRVRRLGGETPWLVSRGKVIRDEQGRGVRMLGVMYDITQRKQMEADLRRLNDQLEEEVQVQTEELKDTVDRLQEEVDRRVLVEDTLRRRSQMLEAFFQHTITPLAFLDRHFDFVRVNEAYAQADGKEPEYFFGKNHFVLYPHDENQGIFEQVLETKQPYFAYAKPFTYPDAPQRVTYWNWLLTPLLDEQGEVQFLVLNLEDVTERQKAFQELEHRARQLQKLTLELSQAEDRERKRLAEILHDDLQQQLAAAKFHLSLLGKRVPKDKGGQGAVEQLDQILKDAIEKSRSLSHELSPALLYQSDLGETFEWLARQLKTKHGLTVHVESRGRIDPSSEALKVFLFKTAQEILFNVVKHARVREARLRIQCLRGGLWLTISDQGQGFDPRSPGKTGGFGLLGIRERIELLGGRMKIRSVPGRGSTFLIVVPDGQKTEDRRPRTDDGQERIQPSSVLRSPSSALRVLLVDDHKVVREGLAALLNEQADLEVIGQAGNGREAVDLACRLGPDVVVMDVAMPLMAGDEATRQIKSQLPGVRVVALSMFEEADMAEAMRQAGAEAYLLKTGPSDKLLSAIRGR
jgi:PAS domain S-box-containing protein